MKRITDFIGSLNNVKFSVNWKPNDVAPRKVQAQTKGAATFQTDLQTGLFPDGGSVSLPAETIYDTCAYLIHCTKHKKVAVSRQSSSGAAWLPFIPLPSNITWNDGALYGSYLILSNGSMDSFHSIRANIPYKEAYIAQVFKLQLPQTLKFITRIIYYIRLDPRSRNPNFKCCQDVGRIEWLPLETLVQGHVNRVWGAELIEVARWCKKPTRQEYLEYSLEEDAYYYLPRDSSRNLEEAMLKTANVSDRDVERLYLHFMQHCFPSFGMTIWSFRAFMLKWGIESDEHRLVRLFHAFNYNRNGFISFHELLLGLACIEQCTSHGIARVKFVFRFYDHENKGVLDEADFRRMVRDMMPRNMLSEYEEKVATGMAIFQQTSKDPFAITYEDFHKAVAVTCKFRRTSTLCRSPKAIFANLNQAMVTTKSSLAGKKMDEKITGTSNRATCHSCKEKPKPLLMSHYLPVGTNRQPLNPVPLTLKSDVGIEKDYPYLPSHPAMQLLTAIRKFAPAKGTIQSPNGLLMKDIGKLMQLFEWLSAKLLNLFDTSEGKWVRVNSPCFVIGDIHGNLEDLLSMERVLWYGLPRGANLVFLGDYVDRGKWGVECALYVMALKALYPHKVTLLRGNHEIRTIQYKYSFENECTEKYGSQGSLIWEMLNRIFDRMPVVATIDDSFFCAHGGIPHPDNINTLADIAKEPLDIKSPDDDSPAVWQIVWSDPMDNAEFERHCEMEGEDEVRSKGFISNIKRGAGNWFNEAAVDDFCARNQLTHIVRAHQPQECGFQFAFHDKCLTIFSSSHYCGQDNEAAVLYLDQEAARAIRIDTQNNAPATDRQ